MLMRVASHRNRFLPLMAALTATAWLSLWLWGHSPYARYLDHGQWTEFAATSRLCRALPGGGDTVTALLFVGGWVLMLGAMMLPTTLPLLDIFRRLTAQRPDRGSLLTLVVIGYLTVWTGFGLVSHLTSWAVLTGARQFYWLTANAWVMGATVLAIAGVYQFSALKYRCLDACRAPLSFVAEHWRGTRDKWQALLLGIRHGVFCVGCCWCLMLLMFVIGTGSVGWMLALGAVMAAEKNLPAGRRLAAPLGAVLLLFALSVAIAGAWG
jgi:predicted metal-binding membrane protein